MAIIIPNRDDRIFMKRIMSNQRAFAIMDNFSRSRVLVIGDIMADHFISGKVSRISPEAPVPVVEVKKDNFTLGGCANVFNNIHVMGGRVHLAGVIGSDETGRQVDGQVGGGRARAASGRK